MAKKKLSYAEAMAEVENIVARMRSGDMGVDELSVMVRRATELISECRQMLYKAEQEVNTLINPEE